MYDKSDPRSALAPSRAPGSSGPSTKPASFGLFYEDAPVEDDHQGKAWYTRGQNLIVNYIEAGPGGAFSRNGQKDEYMIIVPDEETPYEISAGGETKVGDGYQMIIVPPGDSTIVLPKGGRIARLFSTQSPDLVQKCANQDVYAAPDPNVPPFQPWPEPPSGYKLRVYDLAKTREPGEYGPIWRCTTIMLNFGPPVKAKRDPSRMSPHSHEDFEQCSLLFNGSTIHHMRWMWGIDKADWREDVHAFVKSPSATMIPARVIHTSEAQEVGNRMCDIFAPPRFDFSYQPGWVRNADDYPMPEPEGT
jgi:hypothetical protein